MQLGKVALDSEVLMVGSDAWNMNPCQESELPSNMARIRRLGRG